MSEGGTESLRYVRDAIASVPGALAAALSCTLPELASAPRSVVTSGIGASEGPARILAALLAEAGMAARFCPISAFVNRPPCADLLVVFSQGLSPNARIALGEEHAFTARWLVTSVEACRVEARSSADDKQRPLATLRERDVTAIVVPPRDEPQALARFCGPTVAAFMAMRLSALLLGDEALAQSLVRAPAAYQAGKVHAPQLSGPLALVTAGALAESAHAHRWKLLEALLGQDPPVWDVLQFAHGPLQAFHDKPLTLLTLESAMDGALVERLMRTLDPARQRVLRLVASLPAPLSFFQHTALLDQLLLAELEAEPRDLFDWPGRHGDAPLYGLGAEPCANEET
jgi:hypothetical protein